MRRLMIATATVAVLGLGGPLVSSNAEAMTMPGAGMQNAVQQNSMTENVRLVCRTVWRFGRPHRVCTEVRPRHFRGHHRFGPRPHRHRW